jgi:AbrB family looped-hinge helix DNA binding protein
MNSFGIIRRIDDIGRIAIPKEIRRNMRLDTGDALEIITNYNNEEIVIRPYRKSWEECAIDFYNNNPLTFKGKDSPCDFYHSGQYTVCFINSKHNHGSSYGVAKRYVKDNPDSRIGEVAAYAHAMRIPINELIGYKGK